MIRACLHCGEDTKNTGEEFCCRGCAAAYKIINNLGFQNYYKLRLIKEGERKLKPEISEEIDITEFATKRGENEFAVSLMVQGLHCAACVWLIESILKKQKNVINARINLGKKTLLLQWAGDAKDGNKLVHLVHEVGYKLLPFDEEILRNEEKKYGDTIMRALAVAGFGAGNVMLFSIVLWFFDVGEIGVSTKNLLQFFSSLIALPVLIYSSRPFFSSAFKSIKAGYPNMDLAISIAIFLACVVSLLETFRQADHVYFDSAVMLVFFLLIGRFLDLRARKRAFAVASEFSLLSASFGRVEENSRLKILPIRQLHEGMILVVAAGEKIAADGIVIEGESELDTSLITGETMPKKITRGNEVFAATINLTNPLRVRISKSSQNSLLAQIIRLSEEVENKKIHYVRLADRLAKFYTPAVHLLAFLTFCLWFFHFKSDWEIALMNATAVLIITCPCALALAVPIIQTIAVSNFIKRGILVKSGEALEKLCEIKFFVFDKTGSLTLGTPSLTKIKILKGNREENFYLKLAASLAQKSTHPVSRAILQSFDGELAALETREVAGMGVESQIEGKKLRLGRKEFCEVSENFEYENSVTSFLKFGEDEVVLIFKDIIKEDAKQVISTLHAMDKKIILLSGDSENVVSHTAKELGISEFYSQQTPVSKAQFLEKLRGENKKFVMIGDGLNDAPALALADVSISFSKASDISQNIADIVIQGQKLFPIITLIERSSKAISLMKQNLLIALIYNLIAVPFAVAGHVVPLIAALAMSSSSLLVLFNSLRMSR